MDKPCRRIIIISNAVANTNRSSEVSLHKFVRIINQAAGDCKVVIISGNINPEVFNDVSVKICSASRKKFSNRFWNIFCYVLFQIKAAFYTVKFVNKNAAVFFWIGDGMFLPYVAAKLMRGCVYYFIYGNPSKIKGANHSKENKTARTAAYFANNARYICAENRLIFKEWGGELRNPNRKVFHLYAELPAISAEKKKTIGMLCRLSDGKYVKESIQAFTALHAEYPNWHLEIVGSGAHYHECSALISRLYMQDHIKLLGWVDSADVPRIISQWMFCFFPTDTEGLPNSLIEAMCAGVPCIASPVGAIPDIIRDRENGFILPDTSFNCMKKALQTAVCTNNYEQMAKAARETIRSRYSFEAAVINAGRELCNKN